MDAPGQETRLTGLGFDGETVADQQGVQRPRAKGIGDLGPLPGLELETIDDQTSEIGERADNTGGASARTRRTICHAEWICAAAKHRRTHARQHQAAIYPCHRFSPVWS